jgi:hypothetical protein
MAESIDIQGTASVPYDAKAHGKVVDEATRQQVLNAAEIDAIKRYAATFSASKFRMYQQSEPLILSHIQDYILSPIVLDQGIRQDQNQYFVVVRVTIDTNRLESAYSGGAAGSVGGQAATRKAALTFLFVARTTASVKQFDDRVTSVNISQDDVKAKQAGRLSGGGASFSSSTGETSSVTTGGSTLRQADQTSYAVDSPEDMNASMLQVFSDAGFDVSQYVDVSQNCAGKKPELLYKAFASSDTLSPDLRKDAFDAARRCNLNTFATGTLDVGLPSPDPVTGNTRVYVSVRAQVNDISGPLPKLLASVGPIQYAGLGPNPDVARRNALTNAANQAAQEISNQLKAKGLN